MSVPPAPSRLTISDQVRELLPTEALRHALAAREHTEVHCEVCGGVEPPESSSEMVIVLHFDPMTERGVAHFAHARCSRSRVNIVDVPDRPLPPGMRFTPVLLHSPNTALIVWEPDVVMFATRPEDEPEPYVALYRSFGFSSNPADVQHPLPGWLLKRQDDTLVLTGPSGPAERFEGIGDAAPAAWWEAAERERRCRLIVGVNLGLDRPNMQRVDAALEDGRAVAASVKLECRPPPPPRRKRRH